MHPLQRDLLWILGIFGLVGGGMHVLLASTASPFAHLFLTLLIVAGSIAATLIAVRHRWFGDVPMKHSFFGIFPGIIVAGFHERPEYEAQPPLEPPGIVHVVARAPERRARRVSVAYTPAPQQRTQRVPARQFVHIDLSKTRSAQRIRHDDDQRPPEVPHAR